MRNKTSVNVAKSAKPLFGYWRKNCDSDRTKQVLSIFTVR